MAHQQMLRAEARYALCLPPPTLASPDWMTVFDTTALYLHSIKEGEGWARCAGRAKQSSCPQRT